MHVGYERRQLGNRNHVVAYIGGNDSAVSSTRSSLLVPSEVSVISFSYRNPATKPETEFQGEDVQNAVD